MHRTIGVGCLALSLLLGCQGKQSTPGGTPGVLTMKNGQPLPDIQVSIFSESHPNQILGVGVTGLDGTFVLRDPEAHRPLWLAPGKYRLTLESVGSIPLRMPESWSKPSKTPHGLEVIQAEHTIQVQVDGIK